MEYRSASVKAVNGKSAKTFALDIVGAYTDESACQSWVRDYKLTSKVLTITDTYALKERKGADVENFMVQGAVYMPGETTPAGYQVKKGYDERMNLYKPKWRIDADREHGRCFRAFERNLRELGFTIIEMEDDGEEE